MSLLLTKCSDTITYSLTNACSEESTELWGIRQITICSCCLYWRFHLNLQKSWKCQAVSKASGHRQMTDIWFVAEAVIFILTTKSTWTLGSTSFQQKGYKRFFIRDKQIWACIWLPNLHQIRRPKNVPSLINMPLQFLNGIVFLPKCKITFILHPCQFTFCHNISDISKWRLAIWDMVRTTNILWNVVSPLAIQN